MSSFFILCRAARYQFRALLLLLCLCLSTPALAGQCKEIVATAVSLQGAVETRSRSSSKWAKISAEDTFCAGDRVRTLANSRAALQLNNNSILRLNEHSTVTFSGLSPQGSSRLDLKTGMAHFISRLKQRFEVITPYVNAGADGTEFIVAVDSDAEQAKITVFEGQVHASNGQGGISLNSGETALTRAGEAPLLQTRVQPWNAVSWALYYPAVTDFTSLSDAELMPSLEYYREGNSSAALAALELLPDGLDSNHLTYRAALYLAAGQTAPANVDLEQALKQDAQNGAALALKAIIAVTQNQTDRALTLARQATEASPNAVAPWLAQSYAQQAVFDLKQAKLSVEQAVKLAPESALSWARLAELHLMFGELDSALQAAQRATDLAPELARSQSVLGFAHLTRIKTKEAKRAFEKAISLDQADPQPRLGLGLALIRRGKLASGRKQIEIAASLAPRNSLIRSYLGKAYYEEKRSPLDATQFALAKELDPNDPTPWFYDAIRKQTENRPVEALQDLEKSTELNDNRAVYRSRLLLDGDQAARSVSQGRIYRDLGFEQLALLEGWKSINTDPGNFSGHRLLADSYSKLPRHEIARVSELLQAQLMQPLNANPIQPQLAESNLGILDGSGPSDLALNEFNPMFTRNGVRFQTNIVGGSNNTFGDDLVLSGIHNKFSYSLGQFRYKTDGFRENNDVEHNIYNLFIQTRINNKTNIQFEYRDTKKDNGDTSINIFQPDSFKSTLRQQTETNLFRIGLNYKSNPNSTFLVSLVTSSADFTSSDFDSDLTRNDEGDSAELVHLGNYKVFNTISGIGLLKGNTKSKIILNESPLLCSIIECEINSKEILKHNNLFFYSYFNLDGKGSTIIAGLTASDIKSDFEDDSFVNPKLGTVLNINHDHIFRMAAFKTTKRNLINSQTLEPTQIAGFNQFFDDPQSAESSLYGIGYDAKLSKNINSGISYYGRTIDFLFDDLLIGDKDTTQWKTQNGNIYTSFRLDNNFSLNIELQYEQFQASTKLNHGILKLDTIQIPATFRYFNSNGIYTGVTVAYVNQDGTFSAPATTTTNDSDNFFVINYSINYRFPKRLGLFSFEVKNLTNEKFNFQDLQTSSPILSPERYVIGRLVLNL